MFTTSAILDWTFLPDTEKSRINTDEFLKNHIKTSLDSNSNVFYQ